MVPSEPRSAQMRIPELIQAAEATDKTANPCTPSPRLAPSAQHYLLTRTIHLSAPLHPPHRCTTTSRVIPSLSLAEPLVLRPIPAAILCVASPFVQPSYIDPNTFNSKVPNSTTPEDVITALFRRGNAHGSRMDALPQSRGLDRSRACASSGPGTLTAATLNLTHEETLTAYRTSLPVFARRVVTCTRVRITQDSTTLLGTLCGRWWRCGDTRIWRGVAKGTYVGVLRRERCFITIHDTASPLTS